MTADTKSAVLRVFWKESNLAAETASYLAEMSAFATAIRSAECLEFVKASLWELKLVVWMAELKACWWDCWLVNLKVSG